MNQTPSLTVSLSPTGQVNISGHIPDLVQGLFLLNKGVEALLHKMLEAQREKPGIVLAQNVPVLPGRN